MSEKPSWTKWVPDAVASTARARVFTSSRIPQRRSPMTISITRVYTRLGDRGETGLVGGKRVPKDSPRIVAYGTIDELNAIVGIVRTFNGERRGEGQHHRWLDEELRRIQNALFDLGSELATPPEAEYEGMFKVGEAQVTALERLMDHCQKDLEPLKSFTLPGGGRINAFLHQARTVCRRAEREVLRLTRVEPVNEWALRYVNRLSRLATPDGGDVRFDGRPILGLSAHRIAALGIGRTFQNLALFPTLTVLQNVMVGVHCRTGSDVLSNALWLPWVGREEAATRERASELLRFLDLGALADHPAAGLPFGTLKRV